MASTNQRLTELPLRVVIVDDEPIARQLVRRRLEDHEAVSIVGEAGDGPSAVTLILETRPDLVFLDIQMPGLSGLEVLDTIVDRFVPNVVFVTAYDQFAVRAFDYHAVDYILKPFDRQQIDRAVTRALDRMRASAPPTELAALLNDPDGHSSETPRSADTRPVRRIPIRLDDRYILLPVDVIDWIEADRNYVRLHRGTHAYPARLSISKIESMLDPARFARIHRGIIVNLDRIQSIFPDSHGDCTVVLTDGTNLRASRAHRARLLR